MAYSPKAGTLYKQFEVCVRDGFQIAAGWDGCGFSTARSASESPRGRKPLEGKVSVPGADIAKHALGQLGDRKLPSLLNAAAIYPRFSPGAGKVITLESQVQSCIKGGLAGTPPELGSPDLVAITAYLGSIAKGQPVEIGGAPK